MFSSKEIWVYIMDNTPGLDGALTVATVMQDFHCKSEKLANWTIDLPEKPQNIKNPAARSAKSDPIKIVHLTDIHYDPEYLVGGVANCHEPFCCRAELGLATNTADAAGRWGDYRFCDTSLDALHDAFNQINKQHVSSSCK